MFIRRFVGHVYGSGSGVGQMTDKDYNDLLFASGMSIAIALVGAAWFGILSIVQFRWQCGLCGKMNRTGFIKFFLKWCDHFGHGA